MLRSFSSATVATVLTVLSVSTGLVALLILAFLVGQPGHVRGESLHIDAVDVHPTTPAIVTSATLVVIAQGDGPLSPPPLRTRGVLPARPVLTPTATLMPTATAPPTATDIAAAPGFLLPTVTPTPDLIPNAIPDAPEALTATDTLSGTGIITAPSIPLPTPTSTLTSTDAPDGELPRLLIQPPTALVSGYRAQGSYSSQTIYTDGQIAQQQGTFAIVQAAAENDYGSNQSFALTSRTADGQTDSIAVFLVDDYIAVNYNDGGTPNAARATAATGAGEWVIVQRSAGSSLVKAIQPITDLAAILPQLRGRTGSLEPAELDGQPAQHLRLDDPTLIGDRLLRPLLGTSGEIRSFKLDAWLVEPAAAATGTEIAASTAITPTAFDPHSYVARYTFQVELDGARVLDANFDEVRADQAVAWTYQIVEVDDSLVVAWPEAAPRPGEIEVPGFVAGTFPLPPNAQWVGLANDVPEVLAPQSQADVATYYRELLAAQGWTVSGNDSLLRCTKDDDLFQLLLVEDADTGGTRISILAGSVLGLDATSEATPAVTP